MARTAGFDEQVQVVVIGSGIGGLACAVHLAKQGLKVKVFEQHHIPGGCCTSFSRKGFKFDAGVLHLTGGNESGAFERVVTALGMQDEFAFREQTQRFIFPGLTLDSSRGIDSLPRQLGMLFPREKEGIEGLFATIKSIYDDVKHLPRLTPLLSRYKDKSFQELMDEYVRDPELKALASSNWHLWNPTWKNSAIDYSALLVTEQLRGYFYPVGGMQAIPDTFVRILKKHGGEIEFRACVDRILVGNGRACWVRLRNGRSVQAEHVVSNVAARATFLNLVGVESLPKGFTASLDQLEISLSAFYVYLGVDIDPRKHGLVAPETIVYESFDNSKEWQRLLDGGLSIPCFGIAVPTYLDPNLAPPGKHAVILMTMAPYNLAGKSWREEKDRFAEELVRKAEKLIPQLSRHILVREAATPLTYERYTLNSLGAAMGWAFTPGMFMKRPDQKTPIPNLYLAGHWTVPGGGVPAVALSGLRAARRILGS
ncbi:MAG: NAD(P)/FAD-dependent oxidoreductase [Dehalococcoidia bacterium]|nr:NAD(P)/FAD-dependent oxidoreductase [Dehalococcoidia bacterium]